jgi:hypothetical protein
MFTAARMCESGADAGKWYTVIIERGGTRRAGYCAIGCTGHESSDEALAHYLQFQLDREADLWLDRRALPGDCEICGARTTLRARLGRDSKLFVLCHQHQSTSSLQILFRRRLVEQVESTGK